MLKHSKIIIKALSMILVLSLSLSMFFVTTASAVDNKISYKLETTLAQKLSEMDADEEIDVSIWVNDIDHDKVNLETREKVIAESNKKTMSQDVLVLLDDAKSLSELSTKSNSTPSSKDTQKLIEIKRSISKEKYQEKNNKIISKLFSDSKSTDISKLSYIGSYAPNFEMTLSKSQIEKICQSSLVEAIYMCGDNVEEDSEEMPRAAAADYSLFNTYKSDTGVTSMQSITEGEYVKIGILDVDGNPQKTLSCFSTAVSEGRLVAVNNDTTYDSHASKVGALLTGEENSFKGIACSSNYVSDYTHRVNNAKITAEALISQGANILTMSFSTGLKDWVDAGTYGDYSKWLDHVAPYHNIHITMAAGNKKDESGLLIQSGNMSYNSIIVGALDYNTDTSKYTLRSDSCYNSNTALQVKPDIVAPGRDIPMPSGLGVFNMTSSATPFVGGALALLISDNSYMMYNPQFAKAALLAGCTSLIQTSTANSTASNQMAKSYGKGAGMLNVYQARSATTNFINCDVGTISAGTALNVSRTFTVNSSEVSAGKKVRAAFCYNVKPAIGANHSTSSGYTPTINHIVMTITTPSGYVYRSNYYNDNKQIICFSPVESGTYTFTVTGGAFTESTGIGYVISKHVATYN